MTINLNTDELKSLVMDHIKSLGFNAEAEVSFKSRNQGNIDTMITIGSSKPAANVANAIKAAEADSDICDNESDNTEAESNPQPDSEANDTDTESGTPSALEALIK